MQSQGIQMQAQSEEFGDFGSNPGFSPMTPVSPNTGDDYDAEELALMAAAEERMNARRAEVYQYQQNEMSLKNQRKQAGVAALQQWQSEKQRQVDQSR